MSDELALLPEDEQAELEAYISTAEAKDKKRVTFKGGHVSGDNSIEIVKGWKRLQEITKTDSADAAMSVIISAAACNPKDKILTQVVEMIEGLAPQTPLEAMLIAQMLAVNGGIRRLMSRAFLPDQTFEGKQLNLNQATKMQRTFLQQVEALQKLRGKGQQKMTVEHVHVYEGGQAVVGDINQGGGK